MDSRARAFARDHAVGVEKGHCGSRILSSSRYKTYRQNLKEFAKDRRCMSHALSMMGAVGRPSHRIRLGLPRWPDPLKKYDLMIPENDEDAAMFYKEFCKKWGADDCPDFHYMSDRGFYVETGGSHLYAGKLYHLTERAEVMAKPIPSRWALEFFYEFKALSPVMKLLVVPSVLGIYELLRFIHEWVRSVL